MMTRDELISEMLLRWEEAWEHGQELQPEVLCCDHPDLEPTVRGRIDALKATAWVKEPPENRGDEGDEQTEDPLPTTLGGRYRIEGFIAEGGHGRVYRAHDPELQRNVAVKIPRTRHPDAADQEDGLLEEARRAGRLRHPGIVAVHDVGRDDGTCFIVSELIEGENLADRIARKRPTAIESALMIIEVAEALHFAHMNGFVHRDIKPSNILIDGLGRTLVTDFGIAARTTDLLQGRVATSGTLPYMAPEQIAGEIQLIDARTDIYALGVVLYELLTGRNPYQARTPTVLREQILFRPPIPLRTVEDRIPVALAEICLRCLAKHPADRYASAEELAGALRAAIVTHPARRRNWLVPLVFVAVTIALGVVAIRSWTDRDGRRSQSGGVDSASPSPFASDGVMIFDGRTRIVTPLDRFAPVTLEAWVRPESYQDHGNQFLIGSDIPTKYGLGLSISGAILSAEYVPGMMFSDRTVPLQKWSHVAAVFGEAETRLYLNGEQIHVGPKAASGGGTKFVIGCAGLSNPIDHFRGQIRSVRISSGERYSGNFRPPETFPTGDAESVLIYDDSHVEGDRLVDRSGKGNHGVVQR